LKLNILDQYPSADDQIIAALDCIKHDNIIEVNLKPIQSILRILKIVRNFEHAKDLYNIFMNQLVTYMNTDQSLNHRIDNQLTHLLQNHDLAHTLWVKNLLASSKHWGLETVC
jgi:hypothetical protein